MSDMHRMRIREETTADEVLAEYMQRLDRGEQVDREALLTEYPEIGDELRSYFAGCDELADFAGGDLPHTARLAYPASSPVPVATEAAPEPTPFPQLLNYEVVEELARGGMGVIYKARQYVGEGSPRPNRLVALKMIRGGPLASSVDIQRFRGEAEAVAKLDHPNIVPIFEVGQQDGQYFFSMKLIEGGSLAQCFAGYRLPRCDPKTGKPVAGNAWSPLMVRDRKAVIVGLITTIARAVHYAHQRGLIHRDLKPANILVDENGQPYVTDFGLAKRVNLPPASGEASGSPLTQSGLIVGTPNYMAPEQARARKALSTAADVYSLGAILYELLTGQPPFCEATPLATLIELLDKEPVPPRTRNLFVDRDLETVCLKCLRKDPQERYGSAEALADDLERWQRGEPIQARPAGWWERGWKWARRRPAMAILGLLSTAAALLGLGIIVWALNAAWTAIQLKDWKLYVSEIGLAHYERVHGPARAMKHLENCATTHRRWEWHYLYRSCQAQLLTLEGHQGEVIAVSYHPDGTRLASAGRDGVVCVWDVQTGAILHRFTGLSAGILSVAYSPDGHALAAAGSDGLILVWDAETGAALGSLRGHTQAVTCVVFHPEGRQIASSSEDGTVRLWDWAQSEEAATVHRQDAAVSGVAFSRDGQRLAWTDWAGAIHIRDASLGLTFLLSSEHPGPWTCVAFSLDGTRLATADHVGRVRICLLDEHPRRVWLRGPSQWIYAVAFSPDGKHLAASMEGSVQVWELGTDVEEGRLAYVLRGHERRTNGLAWNADGSRLASASADGTVKVWDPRHDPEGAFLSGHTHVVTALTLDPASTWLASASRDGTIRITDPRTRQLLRVFSVHTTEIRSLTVSRDGRELIGGDASGLVRVWDAANGTLLRQWVAHSAPVCALALHADGREILTAATNGTLHRWDVSSGQPRGELKPKPGPLMAAAFSRDGRYLATAAPRDEDEPQPKTQIELWDVDTGQRVRQFKGHPHLVTGLAFDSRDRLASVSYDKSTRIWDVATADELLLLSHHTEPALAVAFSPDNCLLVTGGRDKSVRIYDGTPR